MEVYQSAGGAGRGKGALIARVSGVGGGGGDVGEAFKLDLRLTFFERPPIAS